MTTFEQPTNRATPPLAAPSDDSLSLQLPMASFAYDDLRAQLGTLAVQFDAFVGEGKQDLLEKRQMWLAGVAEDRERYAKLQQDFEFYTSQEAVLSRTMEKERQEAIDVRGEIDEFARQRQAMQERKDALQAQVDAMRAELRRKREAKQAARRALEAQRSKNEPELKFFEDKLSMQIVGIKEDVLSFVFTHVDERDYDRKFLFTIDVTEREYKVVECTPPIANLPEMLDTLNRTRDFFGFLKHMRKAFKEQTLSLK